MECFFQEKIYLCIRFATIAQLVEHWLPKPRVAGSSPVRRSLLNKTQIKSYCSLICVCLLFGFKKTAL